jgi:hypothetical protein
VILEAKRPQIAYKANKYQWIATVDLFKVSRTIVQCHNKIIQL